MRLMILAGCHFPEPHSPPLGLEVFVDCPACVDCSAICPSIQCSWVQRLVGVGNILQRLIRRLSIVVKANALSKSMFSSVTNAVGEWSLWLWCSTHPRSQPRCVRWDFPCARLPLHRPAPSHFSTAVMIEREQIWTTVWHISSLDAHRQSGSYHRQE